MILIKNLTKNIGLKTLFQGLALSIYPGERVALIGPNGSGKSTLLKILAGLEEADKGSFSFGQEKVAYVPQELVYTEADTVASYLNTHAHSIGEIFLRVGLPTDIQSRLLQTLSGGQKTRCMLAKAILMNPKVLLIDEPTNHLDADGVLWFRSFLKSFRGTVLVVSHDRQLLEDMTHIVELNTEEEPVEIYQGGWQYYVEESKRRKQVRINHYDDQQREKERLEERLKWFTIQSQRSSNPTLGKKIRAMEKRIEREIYSQELSRPSDGAVLSSIDALGSTHNAKLLVSIKNLSYTLGDKHILYSVTGEVRGRERVILSGKNGSGKSTLMKIIVDELQPTAGECKLGANMHAGYFAQEHEVLDTEKTVEEEFLSTDRLNLQGTDHRVVLGHFLFSGNTIFKKVALLSPGERVRLLFAKLTHQSNELLLLDEPTNHLDLISKQVIEEALSQYQGGILAVSHDPYFIEAIGAKRKLVIENGNMQSVVL